MALPDPVLYGQFHHLDDIDIVLNGLLQIGFQKVFETAWAAEILSDYARHTIKNGEERVMPQISSACPTILRLIRTRFPKLIPNVASTITPVELAAILARREAEAETGLPPEEIGVFSIVPCSSQVTAAHTPEGLQKPVLDGAFAIRDVYLRLLGPMRDLKEVKPMCSAGIMGIGWACCGGESAARLGQSYLAVDGIENCIRMLEEIEDGRLPEADFIELCACTQGCVGGLPHGGEPLRRPMRIKKLMKGLPVSRNRFDFRSGGRDLVRVDRELQYLPSFQLDQDRGAALEKLVKIEELERSLPGLDCGSCGAPPATPWPRTWSWAGPPWRTASSRSGSGCSTWPGPERPTNTCPPPSGSARSRSAGAGPIPRKEDTALDCQRTGQRHGPPGILPLGARAKGLRRLCGGTCSPGSWAGPRRGTPG